MKITGIYQIKSKCKPDRIYVGSAIDIKRRWRRHKILLNRGIHFNIKLQNHFNKYLNDLHYSIITECSEYDLIKNEQKYIDKLNPWFNIRKKANSNLGIKLSIESRERMKNAQRKAIKFYSEETRLIMGKYHIGNKNMLGKHHSEQVREKIRQKLIGRKREGEIKDINKWKENISKALMGKKKPQRTKEHIENWRLSRMKNKCA